MEIPQRGGLPHSDIHGSTPARGSPWLFAACHVLHRLLVPRHPPNALITLENLQSPLSEASTPCTGTILSKRQTTSMVRSTTKTAAAPRRTRHGSLSLSTKHFTPLNNPGCGRPDKTDRSAPPNLSVRHRNQARPETHQNLIHPDKDHTFLKNALQARPVPPPPAIGTRQTRNPNFSAVPSIQPSQVRTNLAQTNPWWRRSGSNRRPPACKAGALPAELRPQWSAIRPRRDHSPGIDHP